MSTQVRPHRGSPAESKTTDTALVLEPLRLTIARRRLGPPLGPMATALTLASIVTFMVAVVARAQPSDFKLAPPSSADAGTYHAIVAQAVAEHRVGHWLEARALFLRAHELEPSARTLRVLGMTAFELREYPDSVRELSAALADARHPLSAAQRRQVQTLLERANVFVGRYRLRLDPPHTRVQLNGVDIALEPDGTLLLPLGRQALVARASGHETVRREVMVDGHDDRTLSFKLEPRWWASGKPPPLLLEPADHGKLGPDPWPGHEAHPTPTRSRPAYLWTGLSGSAAAALAVTSIALFRRAVREDRALQDQCMGGCDPSEGVTSTRDRLRRSGVATLGTSLVLVASAVALYFIEARAARARK